MTVIVNSVLRIRGSESEKQDPDPDPHQCNKAEALEGHFGALKGPNLEKGEWLNPDPDQYHIER
jgi:hypothetical protein